MDRTAVKSETRQVKTIPFLLLRLGYIFLNIYNCKKILPISVKKTTTLWTTLWVKLRPLHCCGLNCFLLISKNIQHHQISSKIQYNNKTSSKRVRFDLAAYLRVLSSYSSYWWTVAFYFIFSHQTPSASAKTISKLYIKMISSHKKWSSSLFLYCILINYIKCNFKKSRSLKLQLL